MEMDFNKEILDIANEVIEGAELFLVHIEIKGKVGNQKIQVFVDGDNFVDINECSKINRELSNKLEERDIVEGRYVVEVSSPGVDRPLVLKRQYAKHVGRELEVITKENGKYTGILKEVYDNEIKLSLSSNSKKKEIDKNDLKLPFEKIDHSKVIIRI